MKPKHILASSLVILSIVYIGLQLMKYEMYASFVRAFMVISLTILYALQINTKRDYFFKFLLTFAIADLLGLLYWFDKLKSMFDIDIIYYVCNGLYIISYLFLIIMVIKSMNLRDVITKLPAYIVILVVLDIFCVTIVTDTAKGLSIYQYSLEFIYNAVIMSLLTLSVINYIYRVNKKAMNLLIASIFIVFSEMIQLAYYYVIEINVLNVLCSLFLVIAFLFFYLQATLVEETEELDGLKRHLEA